MPKANPEINGEETKVEETKVEETKVEEPKVKNGKHTKTYNKIKYVETFNNGVVIRRERK